VFIIFRMPLGVALSGPPSEFTATVNFLCNSTVHLSLAGLLDWSDLAGDDPAVHDAVGTESRLSVSLSASSSAPCHTKIAMQLSPPHPETAHLPDVVHFYHLKLFHAWIVRRLRCALWHCPVTRRDVKSGPELCIHGAETDHVHAKI
jgi:hypothetical protein